MAKDRTIDAVPDSWSHNVLLSYPPIFMYLYTDLHHMTIEQVTSNNKAIELYYFSAKYQLLSTGIVSAQIHSAMNTDLYPLCPYTM